MTEKSKKLPYMQEKPKKWQNMQEKFEKMAKYARSSRNRRIMQ